MVVQFVRPEPGSRPNAEQDGGSQPQVPQELLTRHGGRTLTPADAAVTGGPWAAPRSTVYRAGSLLVPNDVIAEQKNMDAFNSVLKQIGLELLQPQPSEVDSRCGPLPRPVALCPRRDATGPVVVDAWTALQLLRASTTWEKPALVKDVVARISVEHLMFGAVDIGGTPWETSGVSDGGSYGRSGRGGRTPVSLSLAPPPRRTPGCPGFDRRPVVAVLDTGIGPHPWFGIPDRTAPPPPDGFLRVSDEVQQAIRQRGEQAAQTTPTRVIADHWDAPTTDNPLVGSIDRDTGHGTFIAGVVRQAAPDADVLALRVLHSDGVAYEGDVLLALWWLADRVDQAQQQGRPQDVVDVVSLSLGYFDESPAGAFTGQLAAAVDRLTSMGVLVVAAAGNDATTRRFYPAALAERPVVTGSGPQVFSVGALNPNGTKALFSNDGSWVNCWATGAAVVSTFPADVQGSVTPSQQPTPYRGALDADDFTAGFAVWDGTSFAAPLAAAALTGALIQSAEQDPALGLGTVDRATTVERAWAAVKRLG